jgi:hypothetical protein
MPRGQRSRSDQWRDEVLALGGEPTHNWRMPRRKNIMGRPRAPLPERFQLRHSKAQWRRWTAAARRAGCLTKSGDPDTPQWIRDVLDAHVAASTAGRDGDGDGLAAELAAMPEAERRVAEMVGDLPEVEPPSRYEDRAVDAARNRGLLGT